jgi:hypothetical protein
MSVANMLLETSMAINILEPCFSMVCISKFHLGDIRLMIRNSRVKQSKVNLRKMNLGLNEGISSGIRLSMQNFNKFSLDCWKDQMRKPISRGSRNNNVKNSGCLIFISA